MSRQTICAIERGKYSPSLEVAFRIANTLCASLEDVFYHLDDVEGLKEYADGLVIESRLDEDDTDDGNQ